MEAVKKRSSLFAADNQVKTIAEMAKESSVLTKNAVPSSSASAVETPSEKKPMTKAQALLERVIS